jgi:hypothetical protein
MATGHDHEPGASRDSVPNATVLSGEIASSLLACCKEGAHGNMRGDDGITLGADAFVMCWHVVSWAPMCVDWHCVSSYV